MITMHIKHLEGSASHPNMISIQQTFATIITSELNFHFFEGSIKWNWLSSVSGCEFLERDQDEKKNQLV